LVSNYVGKSISKVQLKLLEDLVHTNIKTVNTIKVDDNEILNSIQIKKFFETTKA